MKTYEETWAQDGQSITLHNRNGPVIASGLTLPRAKLAAQAPAMARLLIEKQYAALDDCGYGICISCGRNDPADIGHGIGPEDAHRTGHEPDCYLLKLMRDAGVIP